MLTAVTGRASDPLNLLALKMVFLSQSVQYIQSSNRVRLNGWRSVSLFRGTSTE